MAACASARTRWPAADDWRRKHEAPRLAGGQQLALHQAHPTGPPSALRPRPGPARPSSHRPTFGAPVLAGLAQALVQAHRRGEDEEGGGGARHAHAGPDGGVPGGHVGGEAAAAGRRQVGQQAVGGVRRRLALHRQHHAARHQQRQRQQRQPGHEAQRGAAAPGEGGGGAHRLAVDTKRIKRICLRVGCLGALLRAAGWHNTLPHLRRPADLEGLESLDLRDVWLAGRVDILSRR